MPACIVICRNKKEEKKKGKIFFINAKHLVTRKNSESFLEESHINEIVKIYRDFINVENISMLVSLDDIRRNDYKLNINLYAKGFADGLQCRHCRDIVPPVNIRYR